MSLRFQDLSGGLAVFGVIIGLLLIINNGFFDGYSLTPDASSLQGGLTIAEQLDNLTLNQGITSIINGIQDLSPATGSNFDLLGGLASIGVGALKTIFGLIIYPAQIVNVIVSYYTIPALGNILGLLAFLVSIYLVFQLLSKYIGFGGDV